MIYRSLGPPGRQCTGCGIDSVQRQQVLRCPDRSLDKCIGSSTGSGRRDILAREDHGFLSGLNSTRFRKRVANCNLNRSQSQARVESGTIHGRGNKLFLEVRIGKGFLFKRRLVLNRK